MFLQLPDLFDYIERFRNPRMRYRTLHGDGADWREGANLGYRLGSRCKGVWLHFHWKAIFAAHPYRGIYSGAREAAYQQEQHHTPAFWLRAERSIPDYAQRRAWLAEHEMDV